MGEWAEDAGVARIRISSTCLRLRRGQLESGTLLASQIGHKIFLEH